VHQQRRAAQIDGAVVVIGDSHVEGLAASQIAPRSENFGIGGDTLPGVASRLQALDLHRASAIVILAGFNDQPDFPDFAARYAALLAAAPPGVPVHAVGLLPIDPVRRPELAPYNARRPELNAAIRDACTAHPGCRYVAPPFGDALAPGEHAGDGLHLNAAGYRLLAGALRAALSAPAAPPTSGG
jgi:lysophospholipase L1-like esterase